ncbi:YsaB family lipoprotein [Enterobacteriaceae bacterium H20N1]|uniref:YsaB family lipoprotein n=2 Tax=Dryocola boscaweniae TaxID=2925397 RepID=A0A9X2W8T2_9ENTR|nr:YsaB family lipoprotein [Dryocola boscaweniae]MCT4703268.1 YsaB family lipoprotein [Dryocola boscaweniae]MCT4715660.1 YsaB family lipoprotein [Dryocola boscaweniae]MCT4720436.1 YsaB family lipoprotein [Dryocola boscaweniae]
MMPEKKNSCWALALAALLLSSCASTQSHPQFAQQAHTPVVQNAEMVETCKQEAAHRYNTRAQRISVLDLKQYQGSFEIKGSTTRQEGFTCSFDESGQFLHLSTT